MSDSLDLDHMMPSGEDCLIKKYPNFVRTFRNKSGRDKIPWQIDHMFASKDLYKKLQKIDINNSNGRLA